MVAVAVAGSKPREKNWSRGCIDRGISREKGEVQMRSINSIDVQR